MVRERLTRGTLSIETAKKIARGDNKPHKPFLDAWNQEDVSEENKDMLPRGRQPGVDYTTFGNLKKIDF